MRNSAIVSGGSGVWKKAVQAVAKSAREIIAAATVRGRNRRRGPSARACRPSVSRPRHVVLVVNQVHSDRSAVGMEPQQVFGKRRAEVVSVAVQHRRLVLLVPELPEGLPVSEIGHPRPRPFDGAAVRGRDRRGKMALDHCRIRCEHAPGLPQAEPQNELAERGDRPPQPRIRRLAPRPGYEEVERDETVDEDRGSLHFSPSRSIVQMSPSRWFCS